MENLASSEWELMLICWERGPVTAREVHDISAKKKPRDYRTILATLRHMAAKGYLRMDKKPGPRNIPTNVFSPAIPRRRALEHRIRKFLGEDLGWRPADLDLLIRIVEKKRGRRESGRKPGKTA